MCYAGSVATYNVNCGYNSTEYSQACLNTTVRIDVRPRAEVRMAWATGNVVNATTGTYLTLAANTIHTVEGLRFTSSKSMYFASSTNNTVVELQMYYDR